MRASFIYTRVWVSILLRDKKQDLELLGKWSVGKTST